MINLSPSPPLVVEPSGSPDYQTAEALIITFIVNNHLDESANKMAETWEKAFLEYLDNYNSSIINITYSAEVCLTLIHTLTSTYMYTHSHAYTLCTPTAFY